MGLTLTLNTLMTAKVRLVGAGIEYVILAGSSFWSNSVEVLQPAHFGRSGMVVEPLREPKIVRKSCTFELSAKFFVRLRRASEHQRRAPDSHCARARALRRNPLARSVYRTL